MSIHAERPWEKVGMDIFYLESNWYIVATDYYSNYFEIEKLNNLQAQEIINFVKQQIARYGVPD